jgi:pimeloyl-ACP methyl ester carboxylesterase
MDPAAIRSYVEHGFEDVPEGGVRLKCSPENEALVYEMATAHDCFIHLARVRCPVTLARGGRSEAFPPDREAAIAARLPQVRCEEHPNLAHLGPLEDPRAVAESIVRALSR